MLFSTIALALLATVESFWENKSEFRFYVKGSVMIHDERAPFGGRFVDVEWERIPGASDYPDIDRTELVHQANVAAACLPAPGGKLKDCEIMEAHPATPAVKSIFQKALDRLVMQPVDGEPKGTPHILVFLLLSNPGGTESNVSYCAPFFCTTVPPPPPPPPPPPERG